MIQVRQQVCVLDVCACWHVMCVCVHTHACVQVICEAYMYVHVYVCDKCVCVMMWGSVV